MSLWNLIFKHIIMLIIYNVTMCWLLGRFSQRLLFTFFFLKRTPRPRKQNLIVVQEHRARARTEALIMFSCTAYFNVSVTTWIKRRTEYHAETHSTSSILQYWQLTYVCKDCSSSSLAVGKGNENILLLVYRFPLWVPISSSENWTYKFIAR